MAILDLRLHFNKASTSKPNNSQICVKLNQKNYTEKKISLNLINFIESK